MKKRILTLFLTLILVFASFSLASCEKSKTNTILTETRFVVYENDETAQKTDMISFYMTSDVEPYGKWQYDVSGLKHLFVFYEAEDGGEYGTFFDGGEASYKTLILKPASEGEDIVTFSLENGEKNEYSVKVSKDKDGIFRVKAERINK